jgi:hypothetical protein
MKIRNFSKYVPERFSKNLLVISSSGVDLINYTLQKGLIIVITVSGYRAKIVLTYGP